MAQRGSHATVGNNYRTSHLPLAAMEVGGADEHASTQKALIVDDNEDLLDTTVLLFQMLGFETLTAKSGNEALQILSKRQDINVLFTDVVMPGISGVELGYMARELVSGIHVILVSGFPQPALLAGNVNLHDFDFLNKPYRMHEITRLLTKAG